MSLKLKNTVLVVFFLIVVFGISFIIFARRSREEVKGIETKTQQIENVTPITQKVLVIIYDIHEDHPERPYNDPSEISDQLDYYLEQSSIFHGWEGSNTRREVSVQIVDKVVYNNNSPLKPGQEGSGAADYNKIIDNNNLCVRANSGEFDEVWLWADRSGGYWESILVGSSERIFWMNSSPLVRSDCSDPLAIMGFNYERTVDEALHSFGHRVENTVSYYLDGTSAYNTTKGDNWYEFDGQGYPCGWENGQWTCGTPDLRGYCGNVHFPPTSDEDYGYYDQDTRSFDCPNWNPKHTGQTINGNCSIWGCSHRGYLVWWYQNMPGRCNGLDKLDDTKMPNWWWLVYKFDDSEPDWGCQQENGEDDEDEQKDSPDGNDDDVKTKENGSTVNNNDEENVNETEQQSFYEVQIDQKIQKPELTGLIINEKNINVASNKAIKVGLNDKITIKGKAFNKAEIIIFIGDSKFTTNADTDGKWSVGIKAEKLEVGLSEVKAQARQNDEIGSEIATLFKLEVVSNDKASINLNNFLKPHYIQTELNSLITRLFAGDLVFLTIAFFLLIFISIIGLYVFVEKEKYNTFFHKLFGLLENIAKRLRA